MVVSHTLFSGSPGTGKTTLAKVLINELNVEKADVLYINASRDNGVEMISKKISLVRLCPGESLKLSCLTRLISPSRRPRGTTWCYGTISC